MEQRGDSPFDSAFGLLSGIWRRGCASRLTRSGLLWLFSDVTDCISRTLVSWDRSDLWRDRENSIVGVLW